MKINFGFKNGSTYNRLKVINKNESSYMQITTSDAESFVYQYQVKLNEHEDDMEFFISEKDYNFLGKLGEFDLNLENDKVKVIKGSMKLTINQLLKHTFMEFGNEFTKLQVKMNDLFEAAAYVNPKDSRPVLRGVIIGKEGIFAGTGNVIYRKTCETGMPEGKTISIPTSCFNKMKGYTTEPNILVSNTFDKVAIVYPGEIYTFNLYEGNASKFFTLKFPDMPTVIDIEVDSLREALKQLGFVADTFIMETSMNKLQLSAIAQERQVTDEYTSFCEIPRSKFMIKYIDLLLNTFKEDSVIRIGEKSICVSNQDTICVAMKVQELV